jgi:DNA-binding NtrC family response regulator
MSRTLHLVPDSLAVVRILVISRESAVLGPLWTIGESNRWQLESATSGWGAMERVQSGITPDLLILDLSRADKDGLHFLRWLRRLRPDLPIVVLCDREDSPTRLEAIRLGASDCIAKPLGEHSLEKLIQRQLSKVPCDEVEISSDDIAPVQGDSFFVAASPVMRKLRTQVELLAETDSPVLLLGEAGSGKETVARLMHRLSIRSGFQFAKINCAALPSDLLESELFGSERNGTGAAQLKPGKLELCEKGTLLLDEITEMPMSLQSKLLQVMQSKRLARSGSGTSVPVDVRILAASPNGLDTAMSENKLREDLCYRLSTYTVRVPPLRERLEEIPLLLHYFMRTLAKQYALSAREFSPAVLQACQSHIWPGNLRELESFVKRFLLAAGKQLPLASEADSARTRENDASGLAQYVDALGDSEPLIGSSSSQSLKSLVQMVKLEAEKNAIAAALERTGWNRKAAARLLKVSYRSLLYKIDQYQMKSPDSPLPPGGNGSRPNAGGFGGNGRAH